jgi:flavin reductase (DIM6/NTAB) family NADH-FMN oxidoreductase RutF
MTSEVAGALRQTLGSFATGVTIASTFDAEHSAIGLTVNAFSSVSLAPPLILWCLRKASRCAPDFLRARHFAIQVLSQEQLALCRLFASPGQAEQKQAQFDLVCQGAPLISQAAAWLACRHRRHYEEGDHWIFIGEVLEAHHEPARQPLVFWRGQFHQTLPLVTLGPNP